MEKIICHIFSSKKREKETSNQTKHLKYPTMSVKRVLTAIQKLYPIKYSELAWDNTGLLVDSQGVSSNEGPVLLTIDLTKSVVLEAIKHDCKLIIAYHPFIFKGIKKIQPFSNPQHDSLVKLISNGISVYSPHTAVDSVRGGVNDWLIEGITDKENIKSVEIISPNEENKEVGVGRLVTLKSGIRIIDILPRLKNHLGVTNLLLATNDESKAIQTVAICAGSGSGVFSQVKTQVDLYITGELSHHEGLSLKESGSTVILANHSNTERGFLHEMKRLLSEQVTDVEFIISESDEDVYKFV